MQIVRIFRKRMNCDKEVETQLNGYLMDYPNCSVVRIEFHRDGGQSCGETLIATMELNVQKENDVVEVVRCKDCKYYKESPLLAPNRFCFRLRGKDGEPVGYNFSGDDFCSRGERKEFEE